MTHAYNPKGEWTSQHLMAVNGKFAGVSRDEFLAVADRFGLGTARQVLKDVGSAVSSWPEFAAKAELEETATKRIREHHRVV